MNKHPLNYHHSYSSQVHPPFANCSNYSFITYFSMISSSSFKHYFVFIFTMVYTKVYFIYTKFTQSYSCMFFDVKMTSFLTIPHKSLHSVPTFRPDTTFTPHFHPQPLVGQNKCSAWSPYIYSLILMFTILLLLTQFF